LVLFLFLVLLLEVFKFLIRVWDDGISARFPPGRADLSMLVSVLECLDKAQSFIHGSSHWQVVHGDLPEGALVIDDEQASQGVTVLLQIDSIVLGDGVGEVRQERNIQLAQSSLCSWGGHPGQVCEVGVHGARHNFCSNFSKLLNPVVECKNFSGADECEIERVEEEHEIFAQVIAELQLGELSVENCCPREWWRWLGYHGFGDLNIVASCPSLSG